MKQLIEGGVGAQIEFVVADSYEAYVGRGGRLGEEYYQFAVQFQGAEETDRLLAQRQFKAYRAQAGLMGEFTGVGLSEEEIQVYMLLRCKPGEDECLETNGGCRPQGLLDHELMAEVLRIKSWEKLEKFEDKYAN